VQTVYKLEKKWIRSKKLGQKIIFLEQRRKRGERWEREGERFCIKQNGLFGPEFETRVRIFFTFQKKNRTRVSNSGLTINAKVRRELTNLLYLFILFTKIKKIWHYGNPLFNCLNTYLYSRIYFLHFVF
jgi:hypothetical protein